MHHQARAQPERRSLHGTDTHLAGSPGENEWRQRHRSIKESAGLGRLRSDPENARLDLHHGPAAGEIEKGNRVLAGRLRDRGAADQPALERLSGPGRAGGD